MTHHPAFAIPLIIGALTAVAMSLLAVYSPGGRPLPKRRKRPALMRQKP